MRFLKKKKSEEKLKKGLELQDTFDVNLFIPPQQEAQVFESKFLFFSITSLL